MDIRETVTGFIADNFIKDAEIQISDDDSFIEEEIIDSTGVLELVAFIEQTFSVSIDDEELIPENLDSVNRIVAFIQLKL